MNMHSRSMATDEVHRFLVALFGRNQRAFLVAIPPDQKPRPGQWMNLETDEQLKAFLAANRDANIYYQVQIVDDGFGGIKASAADIVGLHAIHVDLDPPKEGGSIEEAKRVFDAVVEKLKEAGCAPSAVVDSGGGYQLVWSIETVPADEGGKTAIETANDEIAIALGGDAAAKDIARLLRLPGTINHPDKRKRARGRIEAPATLLELPGGLHEIDRVVETVRLVGAELGLTRPAAVATSKQPSTEEYAQARKYLRKHPNALPKALETRLEEAQLHSQRLRCRWRRNADGLHGGNVVSRLLRIGDF